MFFFASISGRNILRLSASFCLARARILCSSSLCRSCNLNRFLEGWEVEVVERKLAKLQERQREEVRNIQAIAKKKGKKGSKTEHAKATQKPYLIVLDHFSGRESFILLVFFIYTFLILILKIFYRKGSFINAIWRDELSSRNFIFSLRIPIFVNRDDYSKGSVIKALFGDQLSRRNNRDDYRDAGTALVKLWRGRAREVNPEMNLRQ
jgi:hypothetical protein